MLTARKPPKSTAFRVFVATLTVLVLWFITAFQLFYNVPEKAPKRTDAIIMLGGISRERLPKTLELQKELNIPVLVISNTNTKGNVEADYYCHNHITEPTDPQLICFTPSPSDTRGEADAIGLLATEHGWKSITVVTSRYHVTRVGRLLSQCTPSTVQMVATNPDFGPLEWLRRFVVETGGLLSVIVDPQCSSPIRN
jgi:uncharacterized SAM-binding protein YcdF (DUF218 family)